MHSVIFSAFISFIKTFYRVFKESEIYRAFDKVYCAISRSYKNSFFVSKIRNSEENGIEKYSLLYKIIHIPFTILEKIGEKAGDFLEHAYRNSVILNSVFAFLDNALALNTRFYGVMASMFLLSRTVFSFSVSLKLLAALFICIFLLITDFNITDFFKESKVVSFILSAIGFLDISWDFYDKKNLKKPSALLIAGLLGAFCGILSLKSLILAAVPFAALVGAAIILKCPIAGIFFSAFLAPFVPTMLLAALILYTSACICFKAIITKNFRYQIDGVGIGLGFFLIFMLISSVFSFNAKKSILVWGLYLIFVGYYFFIINTVKTKKQLYAIIKVFVIAGLFVSLYGIMQYVFGWNTSNAWIDEEMFEDATMRAYSTMENPNVLGEYLLFIIPFSAFLFLNKNAKIPEKLFWLATAGISTLCMIFTQSRGCWIGLMVSAAIFVTFYNGKIWGILPIFLLMLPFVLPDAMIDRFLSVGNLEDSSTSYRVFIWLGTVAMLRDFWIGGIGMGEGAFRSVYPFYSYNSIIAPHSHNLYLQLLAEGGICALLIFIITMIIYFKKMSSIVIASDKHSLAGIFSLSAISAVFGFLVQSLFDYTFYNYRMMAMFFIIIALSVSLKSAEEGQN